MKRQRILFFVAAMIFIAIIASTSFKATGSGGCSEVCTDEDEPCCCEEIEGYYLEFYMCTCAGGELIQNHCSYWPI